MNVISIKYLNPDIVPETICVDRYYPYLVGSEHLCRVTVARSENGSCVMNDDPR